MSDGGIIGIIATGIITFGATWYGVKLQQKNKNQKRIEELERERDDWKSKFEAADSSDKEKAKKILDLTISVTRLEEKDANQSKRMKDMLNMVREVFPEAKSVIDQMGV